MELKQCLAENHAEIPIIAKIERPEAVEAGTAKLVGTDTEAITSEAAKLLDDPAAHAKMAKAVNPFGDGHSAERIVKILLDHKE